MEEKVIKSGIYSITNFTNEVSGKRYIGSAKDFKERWKEHKKLLRKNKHHSRYLQNAWNKYGEENFKFEIICYVEDVNKLLKIEQTFLDLYQSYNNKFGYNMCLIAGSTLGKKCNEETKEKIRKGNLGKKMNEESKRKISEANKGKKRTEETKKKMSESNKRREPMKEETKKKISESLKGQIISEETCKKISKANMGRKHTEESKKKISESKMGNQHTLGLKHTEESKQKMSESAKKSWVKRKNKNEN